MNAITLSLDQLRELIGTRPDEAHRKIDNTYLSIYVPTHRHFPDNQQDPIRYRNLLKSAEESLLQRHPAAAVETLLQPFRALCDDREFWNHTAEGLAVLGSGEYFRTIKLHRTVPERAIVAGSFHIKPLLRIAQSADRYQILCLDRQKVQLFEGNRDYLEEVELAADVPRTITDALGEDVTSPHLTVTSHFGASAAPMHHGHGSKKDEMDKDVEKFFRAVDRPILDLYSRPSGLPLILAALAEHHTLFREVSYNPYLITKGIETNADALTVEQLRERAWHVMEPEYRARLRKLADAFAHAQSKQLGSSDLSDVAIAAVQSRVDTLLIEADRQVPGRLDPDSGKIETTAAGEAAEVDDLLDDLAELVLSRGGQVVVVPASDMPVQTGLAATYRF